MKCHFLSSIFFIKGNQRGAASREVRFYLSLFILFLVFFSVAFETTFVFFFCPRGTGSSLGRFEFARYLPPFNGSLRERRGFDRSSCEMGTNVSRVFGKKFYFHGLQSVREGLNGRSLLKEPSFGHNPRDHPVDGV